MDRIKINEHDEHHEHHDHHDHHEHHDHHDHDDHKKRHRKDREKVIAIVNNNFERKENDELEKIQHSANALALNNSFNNHIEQKNKFESEDD